MNQRQNPTRERIMFRDGDCVLRASERASRCVHLMEKVVTEQDFAEVESIWKGGDHGKANFEGKGSGKRVQVGQ